MSPTPPIFADIRINELQIGELVVSPRKAFLVDARSQAVIYRANRDGAKLWRNGTEPNALKAKSLICLLDQGSHYLAESSTPRPVPEHRLTCGAPAAIWAPLGLGQSRTKGETEEANSGYVHIACFAAPAITNPLPGILPDTIELEESDIAQNPALSAALHLLGDPDFSADARNKTVCQRLAEIVAISVVEFAVGRLAETGVELVGGLYDRNIREVLRAMHREPRADWTIAQLCERAQLSRSTFLRRFTSATRVSPMVYLLRLRMHIAMRYLRSSDLPVATIAEKVGFQSTAAFSRAFKKEKGEPPGSYRLTMRR